jgi:hypothetical protein
MKTPDEILLDLSDHVVGWNRDRGAADQWEIARALADMHLVLLIASALCSVYEDMGTTSLVLLVVVLPLIGTMNRWEERKAIRRLESSSTGAQTARLKGVASRYYCLVASLGFGVRGVWHMEPMALFFALGMTCLGACQYAKASMPPPPTRRTEDETVEA